MSSSPFLPLKVSPRRDRSQNRRRNAAYASAWQASHPGAFVASYDFPTPCLHGLFGFIGISKLARTHPHRLNNDNPAGPQSLDDPFRVVQ